MNLINRTYYYVNERTHIYNTLKVFYNYSWRKDLVQDINKCSLGEQLVWRRRLSCSLFLLLAIQQWWIGFGLLINPWAKGLWLTLKLHLDKSNKYPITFIASLGDMSTLRENIPCFSNTNSASVLVFPTQ